MAKGDVILKFEGNAEGFLAAVEAVHKKLTETKGKVEEVDKGAQSSAKFMQEAGKEMASAFGLPITPLQALVSAIGMIKGALEDMNARAERGKELLIALHTASKEINQVSDNMNDLTSKKQTARAISEKYGIPLERSMGMVTQGTNYGFNAQEMDVMAQSSLYTSNPQTMIDAVGKWRGAFKEKGGSIEQIINKLGVAAKASDMTLEQMAPATTIAATHVNALGSDLDMPDSDLLGVLAAVKGKKSGDEVAHRMARYAANLRGNGFDTRKGLLDAHDQLTAKFKDDPNALHDMFAKKEGGIGAGMEVREAYDLINNNRPEIEGYIKKIQEAQANAGTDKSWHRQTVQRAEVNDAVTLKHERERIKLENTERASFGDERALSESELLKQQRISIENEDNPIKAFQIKTAGKAAQWVGGGQDAVSTASGAMRAGWDWNPMTLGIKGFNWGAGKVDDAITWGATRGMANPHSKAEIDAGLAQMYKEHPELKSRSSVRSQKLDDSEVKLGRTGMQVTIGNVAELSTAIADKISDKKKPPFSRNAGNPDERAP